jgi:hypothetical protein
VILVTDVNSHAAVLGARKHARSLGRRCLMTRRLGLSRFRALLGELEHQTPTQMAVALGTSGSSLAS